MAFHGFSAEGVDLLQLNRLQNSKEFYDAHKDEIKRLSIRPFHELIAEMTPEMVKIDPQFVTVPSRMVSRVRRDTRYTKDKTLYRANMWLFFRRATKQTLRLSQSEPVLLNSYLLHRVRALLLKLMMAIGIRNCHILIK